MKSLALMGIVLLTSACSMAPYTSPKTARALGQGNWEVSTGLSPAFNVSAAVGVHEKVEVGVLLEQQFFTETAVWGKFTALDFKDDGPSVAFYGGGFLAVDASGTDGYFLGPIVSFKKDWFEMYLVARYNKVNWETAEITLEDQNDADLLYFDWSAGSTQYYQYVLGINFWFTQKFALNISAQYWQFIGSDAEQESIEPGVELVWRF